MADADHTDAGQGDAPMRATSECEYATRVTVAGHAGVRKVRRLAAGRPCGGGGMAVSGSELVPGGPGTPGQQDVKLTGP